MAKAYILGDTNKSQIVDLNRPATIRCLAGGYPKPTITWWRGTNILPLKSARFEVNRDYSIDFNSVALSDLGQYICQAYSGQGKPVSMYVTLLGVGPVRAETPDDEPYLQYIVPDPNWQQPPQNYVPTRPPIESVPFGKQTIKVNNFWFLFYFGKKSIIIS